MIKGQESFLRSATIFHFSCWNNTVQTKIINYHRVLLSYFIEYTFIPRSMFILKSSCTQFGVTTLKNKSVKSCIVLSQHHTVRDLTRVASFTQITPWIHVDRQESKRKVPKTKLTTPFPLLSFASVTRSVCSGLSHSP